MPRVQLPDGKIAEFPADMSTSDIEAVIQKQFPPPAPAVPKQQMVEFPSLSGYVAGNIGRNWPQIASLIASGAPGAGILGAAGRPLAAAALTAAGGKGSGEVLTSALGTLGGEVAGGLAKPIARSIGAATDKTVKTLTQAISKAIPEFKASTPAGVINKILGGEGMREVGENFGKEYRKLVEKNMGPDVLPPGEVTEPARDLIRRMSQTWPAEQRASLDALNRKYYIASQIKDWVESTPLTKLMPGTGKIDVTPLQEALVPRRRVLKDVLPGVEGIMRMPAESAARDVAATGLLQSVGGHATPGGFAAYLRKLPHAPRLAEEGPIPDLAAQVARSLGTAGTSGLLAPAQEK